MKQRQHQLRRTRLWLRRIGWHWLYSQHCASLCPTSAIWVARNLASHAKLGDELRNGFVTFQVSRLRCAPNGLTCALLRQSRSQSLYLYSDSSFPQSLDEESKSVEKSGNLRIHTRLTQVCTKEEKGTTEERSCRLGIEY